MVNALQKNWNKVKNEKEIKEIQNADKIGSYQEKFSWARDFARSFQDKRNESRKDGANSSKKRNITPDKIDFVKKINLKIREAAWDRKYARITQFFFQFRKVLNT